MIHYVYAIESLMDGRIYVGMTTDLDRRLKEHNGGKTRSTKAYRPWKVLFTEECESRISARSREKFLKGCSGKEFLKSLK